MQNLPPAEIYSREFKYMPWGLLLAEVLDYLVENVRPNGRVLDLLCGPGYLAGRLKKRRPDISIVGVDLEEGYVEYAAAAYPEVEFLCADALQWQPTGQFDAVVCTGGLHHIEYEKQADFVERLSELTKADDGFAIVGDPYIDSYSTETERRIAAAKLGGKYLVETINSGADEEVLKAAIEIISNDIFLVEFKTSTKFAEENFQRFFSKIEQHKTWPMQDTEYGDYYYILGHS